MWVGEGRGGRGEISGWAMYRYYIRRNGVSLKHGVER